MKDDLKDSFYKIQILNVCDEDFNNYEIGTPSSSRESPAWKPVECSDRNSRRRDLATQVTTQVKLVQQENHSCFN